MYKCSVIGLSDSHRQWLPPMVMRLIASGHIFSGGRRHHEIVASLLPPDAVWIDITVPINRILKQYEKFNNIVIFASGDPLFYGFANTIKRVFPNIELKVYPAFNSLQMLAHRLNMAYHDMCAVSFLSKARG